MKKVLKFLFGGLLVLALVAVAGFYSMRLWWSDHDQAPESATGRREIAASHTKKYMVVAAHPLATEAGERILAQGGNAADAAVAVQAMLTLVEPQSSGIGGGAFMLHYNAEKGEFDAYDGRETAPKAASSELFIQENGEKYQFFEALVGGRSVGTPGVLRMLEEAHRWHGKLPWKVLFEPAIEVARKGFKVTPRLHLLLRRDPAFRAMAIARSHFYQEDGRAKPIGEVLKNPQLADTLEIIANKGADGFYTGEVAEDIVKTVKQAQQPSKLHLAVNYNLLQSGAPYGIGWEADTPNPGLLSLEDLKNYQSKLRKPVCIDFHQHEACGFPPPTSGGITSLQILGILSHFDLAKYEPNSVEAAHLFAEASKIAFADRNKYIADPDFVRVPTRELLSPEYLKSRAALISLDKASGRAKPGNMGEMAFNYVEDTSPSLPSTSHFVIVDTSSNTVSMTTSVENVFGSRTMVRGFVLNNQLTDFSFQPERNGKPIANAVAPLKRPRSSMCPLLIFDKATKKPVLAIGSPGGSRIIDYTVRAALGVLVWKLPVQEAVELPHVINRNGPTELEAGAWPKGQLEKVKKGLTALGHQVKVKDLNSGLHAIHLQADGFHGGVDPRREGLAKGQ